MPQNARLAEDGHGSGVLRCRLSSAQTRPPRVGCGAAFRPDRRAAFLGHIIFQVEGGLVTYRMRWPLGDRLRCQCDVECSGSRLPRASEILDLMRDDIPLLNETRA